MALRADLPQRCLGVTHTRGASASGMFGMKHLNSATSGCREHRLGVVLRKAGESSHRLVANSKLAARMYFGLYPLVFTSWFRSSRAYAGQDVGRACTAGNGAR